MDDDEEKG